MHDTGAHSSAVIWINAPFPTGSYNFGKGNGVAW